MRQTVTFVGPIQESGPKRKKKWLLLVLQTGSPILLEYASEEDAIGARRALLQAPNAYAVPTVKLLHGVHDAIQRAAKANLDSSVQLAAPRLEGARDGADHQA